MNNLSDMLTNITRTTNAKTRSICAENPNGEKGAGAQAESSADLASSRLGKGWKVLPCITLPALSTSVIAQIEGPGTILHIWITSNQESYRDCLLRMYWDDETEPSIETPLGDFFCCGHGLRTLVNSIPIAVNPRGGFTSYWRISHNLRHWNRRLLRRSVGFLG